MSISQILFPNHALRITDGSDFDGTNDYMTRGADLTGTSDSKSGILSYWVRLDSGTLGIILKSDTVLGGSANYRVQAGWSAVGPDTFYIAIRGTDTAVKVSMESNTAYALGATWYHVLMSWDVASSAGHVYVNDVEDRKASPTLTNANLDYTVADWAIAASPDGTNRASVCLADFYFAPGQYLDFSNVANRRKFISPGGKPVHLGLTGALPTGTAPLIYFHIDDGEAVANFATNRGTGGNFSITGTLATASSSPSD